MSVRIFAPAKVNLTLEVNWPYRATGRHPLQSVVAFADVGDWIEAEADTDTAVTFHIDGPFSAALLKQSDNLVLDAIALMQAQALKEQGGRVRLTKNLPIASGIGGGSSDAAATLKALNALWSLDLDEAALMQIARGLGGDAPVCVRGQSAYMTGEGEIVTPIALPALDAVLVNPGVAVSTASVFQHFDSQAGGAAFVAREAPHWRSFGEVCNGVAERGNMLTQAARELAPAIAEVEAALIADSATRQSGLSGSGATMFALTETAAHAQALAERLRARFPAWWVAPTRLALDATGAAR